MKKNTKCILPWLIKLILAGACLAQPNNALGISINSVREEITRNGLEETVRRFESAREDWEQVLNAVSEGKLEWIEIGLNLRRYSDASMTQSLDLALGAAVIKNAQGFLNVFEKYPVKDFDLGPKTYEPPNDTLDRALEDIRLKREALQNCRENIDVRDLLLRQLDNVEQTLRKYFGALTPEVLKEGKARKLEVVQAHYTADSPYCFDLSSGPLHYQDSNTGKKEFYRIFLLKDDLKVEPRQRQRLLIELFVCDDTVDQSWKLVSSQALMSENIEVSRIAGWNGWNSFVIEGPYNRYTIDISKQEFLFYTTSGK